MENIDIDFKRKCIEDVIRLNNGAALQYMAKRSNLDFASLVPGSNKTYMQMAIDYGANKVVDMLLESDTDVLSDEKANEAFSYLLNVEKRTLFHSENNQEHSEKMGQLLMIASSLMKACSKLQYSLKKRRVQTPIARSLMSYQAQMG